MRCPFLREAQVKFCCVSEFKKMIVRSQGDESNERCSSPTYVTCPAAKQRQEDLPSRTHCPFLQESLVQYCSAASVVKYVPYNDLTLSRCGNSSHRYCELLMMLQNPGQIASRITDVAGSDLDESESSVWLIDGLQTTGWLFYSANHMWADIDDEKFCHVGIDPFLAKVLGKVEKVTFATTAGEHHPTVSITSNGIDFQMVFPRKISISSINSHLRVDPGRLTTDPYTFGWLFEGTAQRDLRQNDADIKQGLVHGKNARVWMESESRRLTEFVHEKFVGTHENDQRLMADGGTFGEDILEHLNKEETLLLFNEFFSLSP